LAKITNGDSKLFKKARMRDFSYFYKLLKNMEKEYKIHLKLGPRDFDIHKTTAIFPPVRLDDKKKVKIIMKGRWKNEYIATFERDI